VTIVETSVWIDFLNAYQSEQTLWMRRNLRRGDLALTDLILTETLQGVRGEGKYFGALNELLEFPVIETAGHQLAIASAEHYRWLRKRGITIRSTIDCLTATFCIREGHRLLHNDRDFVPFEKHLGLKVIHPANLAH
jgi:predicted nucleic acid-binding protein